MTLHELAERDLRKAEINLARALTKPNVTETEIENLERLRDARRAILGMIDKAKRDEEVTP